MTPQTARQALARQLARNGSDILLRRAGVLDFPIRARVTGFAPQDLTSGIEQGDSFVILPAEPLEDAGWPLPVRENDQLEIDGAITTVLAVNDRTRRIDGVLIAYELQVRGA